MSETHTDDTDIVDIAGYSFLANHRKQNYKRKSGGVGIYIKDTLAPYVDVIENSSEYILWVKLNIKHSHSEEPLILGSIYLPPENSRFLNDQYLDEFENEIDDKCSNFKYVYLIGDTNGRTGKASDFISSNAHLNTVFEIDIDTQAFFDKYILLENLAIPLERCSLDKRSNVNGMRLIEICRNNNLFILNGRLFKDQHKGTFTFRDKSVIDYAIASAECFEHISDFEILHTDALFSDGHNAIILNIEIPELGIQPTPPNIKPAKPIWKPELASSFVDHISLDKINTLIKQLVDSPCSTNAIDTVTNEISSIFSNAANNTFPPKKSSTFHHKGMKVNSKPWFGPKCHKARNNYHDARLNFRNEPNPDNKLRLQNASKQYKRTMNIYIKKYEFENQEKLRKLSTRNPKEYWKFLNSLKKKTNK